MRYWMTYQLTNKEHININRLINVLYSEVKPNIVTLRPPVIVEALVKLSALRRAILSTVYCRLPLTIPLSQPSIG